MIKRAGVSLCVVQNKSPRENLPTVSVFSRTGERKRATILLYLAVTPDKSGLSVRTLIRNTWAVEAKLNGIEVIFSIGIKTETDLYQSNNIDAIVKESTQFNDILLANFADRCSQIPLMASMDSDAVVFGENLKNLLNNSRYTFNGYLGCTVLSKQPIIRDITDRYYVGEWQWPGKVFPDYCSGTIIIENVQAAGLKLRNLPGIQPWLPIDDVCRSLILAVHPVEADKLAAFYHYR
uniref:Hexosyltransferase n=1 Tax=Setaria digitata TaxID=48799 RepID=A0A915Q0C6_9BILA